MRYKQRARRAPDPLVPLDVDGDGAAAPRDVALCPAPDALPILASPPDTRYHSLAAPGQVPGNCHRCQRNVLVARSALESALAAGILTELVCHGCWRDDRDRAALAAFGRRRRDATETQH